MESPEVIVHEDKLNQDGFLGGKPAQVNARYGGKFGRFTASPDKVDAKVIGVSKSHGTSDAVFNIG